MTNIYIYIVSQAISIKLCFLLLGGGGGWIKKSNIGLCYYKMQHIISYIDERNVECILSLGIKKKKLFN